jgi:Glycosyltransferase family 87
VERRDRTTVLFALLGVVLLGWFGLSDFAFNDYDVEVRPAFNELLSGNVHDFLLRSPAYGGALLLRAPFAFVAHALGGGELAVFRAVAIPGLLALAALGVVLARRARDAGAAPPAAWLVLALCVVNPITLKALDLGHAEELLAGALVVAAMLAAQGRRPGWAGVLVGLAVAVKPWALIALPAVIVVLPEGRRRAAAIGLGLPVLLFAPFLIAQRLAEVPNHPTAAGDIFKPWQVWWPLGSNDTVVVNPGGGVGSAGDVLAGYRHPPSWLSSVIHPAIVLMAVPLAALWARRPRPADGLLLLALLLFLRCLLDPWNNVYYVLPCVLALVAADALRGRAPFTAVAVTGATWLTFVELSSALSPDAACAVYLAWAVPFAAALAARVYAPEAFARRLRAIRARQSRLVSSFGYELNTSGSSAVTATRSSIRTPKRPGR